MAFSPMGASLLPTAPRPALRSPSRLPPQWRKRHIITLVVTDLPLDVEAFHIWKSLSHRGKIAFIDIRNQDNRRWGDNKHVSAFVKFDNAPSDAFWCEDGTAVDIGTVKIDHPNRQAYPAGLQLPCHILLRELEPYLLSRSDRLQTFPPLIKISLSHIDFGLMMGPNRMKIMKTISGKAKAPISVELSFTKRSMVIFFPITTWNSEGHLISVRNFKIVFGVRDMRRICHTQLGDSVTALVLPLLTPPKYFWREEHISSKLFQDPKQWNERDSWYRATDVAEDLQGPNGYPLALVNDIPVSGYMEIGRWTAFRLVFKEVDNEIKEASKHFKLALEDLNIRIEKPAQFEIARKAGQAMWTYLGQSRPTVELSAFDLLMGSTIHLPFEVQYQLEVCVSRGLLNDHNITNTFLQRLADMAPIKAKLLLEYVADENKPIQDPDTVFNNPDANAYLPNVRLPYYCAMVRKAIITPTTMRLNTPNPETSNRVIRRYNDVQDRFLRVQFVEDENESGRIMGKPQNDALWQRVARVMYWGINIAGRHYEFLAFGSSQLRVSGAYFFCPTPHLSCNDIRDWMGQLDHIKVVAKYAARLGQCFSTTREIRGIQVPKITAIDDIERNGHCFTDGVGKISPFLASMVISEMNMDVFDDPCAFQFRMGGCKGVLTVCPEVKGMEVQIRPSQEKFKAEFNGLEIIRCAKYTTATLNRQTITILESLGVPTASFMRLLRHQLQRYQKAVDDQKAAIELLTQFVDENGTTLVLAELLKANFKGEGRNEPFVVNILNLWRAWSLRMLKEKARIVVEESAFVLGVVDEKGLLKGHDKKNEGSPVRRKETLPQIFLQISDPKCPRRAKVIQGLCIVGRNPSLHPGDIQVVNAVDEPRLRHLKNVVVFPSIGDRPVPNMLSGGDLDGDDYFVIWDKTLIPLEWNCPPMNYSGPEPLTLQRDVEVDDIRNFFVKYMQNDVLPMVATAHLAIADKEGPKSRLCLQLADLHSTAVDYPKTGQPAEWGSMLSPREWPHFMQRKQKSYRSRKALGRIFDTVCKEPTEFHPDWENHFDPRVLSKYDLGSEILEEARVVKRLYDTSVRRLLAQHNLDNEFELWSGFAMSRPAVGNDYKRQEDLGHEYDCLKQRFRELCYEKAGGNSAEKIDPFVAAMYKVTEEELKTALFEYQQSNLGEGDDQIKPPRMAPKSMPLITFPWVFHWIMIRIALDGRYKPNKSLLAHAKRDHLTSERTSGKSESDTPKEPTDSPLKKATGPSTSSEASEGADNISDSTRKYRASDDTQDSTSSKELTDDASKQNTGTDPAPGSETLLQDGESRNDTVPPTLGTEPDSQTEQSLKRDNSCNGLKPPEVSAESEFSIGPDTQHVVLPPATAKTTEVAETEPMKTDSETSEEENQGMSLIDRFIGMTS